jgi:hypothetical protein
MLKFCLKLELLKFIFKMYSLGGTFFLFQIFDFNVLGKKYLFIFFLEFAQFFPFFSQQRLPS